MSSLAPQSLVILVLALLGLGGLLAWRLRRLARDLARLQADLSDLRTDWQTTAAATLQALERLEQAELQLAAQAGRLDGLESLPGTGTHAEAVDAARAGVPATELAGRFGLSLGEAELIVQLHAAPR